MMEVWAERRISSIEGGYEGLWQSQLILFTLELTRGRGNLFWIGNLQMKRAYGHKRTQYSIDEKENKIGSLHCSMRTKSQVTGKGNCGSLGCSSVSVV